MKSKLQNLFIFLFLVFNLAGCAGIWHSFDSVAKDDKIYQKEKNDEWCHKGYSFSRKPSYREYEFEKVIVCLGTYPSIKQSHAYFVGPFIGFPLPIFPTPFIISDLISPLPEKEIGQTVHILYKTKKQGITFDPSKVRLIKIDKSNLIPESVSCGRDSHISRYDDQDPASCEIKFDAYEWDFDLLVNGFELDGKPYELPIIHFIRGSSWSGDTAP